MSIEDQVRNTGAVELCGMRPSVEEPTLRFCRDCRHGALVTVGDMAAFVPTGACSHPNAIKPPDLVTGDKCQHTMREERTTMTIDSRFCGPEGRWWEARTEIVDKSP